jgi:NAD(P)-dependent dehydrogenase (short-subunit alcohol dehydrogenase family)
LTESNNAKIGATEVPCSWTLPSCAICWPSQSKANSSKQIPSPRKANHTSRKTGLNPLALAETGTHVLVHYGRSVQEAQSLVESIHSKGGRADAIRADLGTPEGATLLAKEVRSIVGKQLDVLVSNAGISKAATIKDHTVEDFDNLFATNVRSPFFLVHQLLPILGEGSNIVVISSIGAHAVVGKPALDNPSVLAYASTKGALETLVKNCAAILGPRGIRVNAVAPGVEASPLVARRPSLAATQYQDQS